MHSAPSSLNQALEQFSTFLLQNGYPERVTFVGPGDLIWTRKRLWVRPPETFDAAEKSYSSGIDRGLGVCLHAFGVTPDLTIATIFIPIDQDEGQRSLMGMGQLKLSAALNKMQTDCITNNLTWRLMSLRHRKHTKSLLDFLQIRAEA